MSVYYVVNKSITHRTSKFSLWILRLFTHLIMTVSLGVQSLCHYRLCCWRVDGEERVVAPVSRELHMDGKMHWGFMQLLTSVQDPQPTSRGHQCQKNHIIPHPRQYWRQGGSSAGVTRHWTALLHCCSISTPCLMALRCALCLCRAFHPESQRLVLHEVKDST